MNNAGTADEPTERQKKLWPEIRKRLIAAVVFFVVYVLSVGPLYWTWFNAKFNTGSAWFAVVYEPLYQMCAICPPLGRVVDAYIGLWLD